MVRAPSSSAKPLSACISTNRRTNSADGSKSQSSASLHAAVSSSSRGARSAAETFRRSTTRWSGDSSHAAISRLHYVRNLRPNAKTSFELESDRQDAVPGRLTPALGRCAQGPVLRDECLDSQGA